MTHILSDEGAARYLYYTPFVLEGFTLALVFRVTHSVYMPFLLLSQSDLRALRDLRWGSF